MPDITLRFDKDMLVLSAPIDTVLEKQGVDCEQDREFISLIEPDSVRDAYYLEQVAGAQCLVTNTAGITAARLTHINMEDRAVELATASLTIVNSLKPQHVFAEIGPTGLPLDISSSTSLKQNRDQYAQAALAFGSKGYDAFFLNGMSKAADMQSALMGVRMESDMPIFASLDIDEAPVGDAGLVSYLVETLLLMEEYGANVVGFATALDLEQAVSLAKECREQVGAPLLVQLIVKQNKPEQLVATEGNPYFCPDTMVEAATMLRGVGVQFLRAAGNASPAYSSALSVASAGFDVVVTGE